jgi:hypothetical protein
MDAGYIMLGIGVVLLIAALVILKITKWGILVVGPLFSFAMLCMCCGAVESLFFTNVTEEELEKAKAARELQELQEQM